MQPREQADAGGGPVRGLIEGFYGPPWSWDARAEVMAAGHGGGMTHYVYAPKDDPLHRERWREPYPSADLDRLAGLVGAGTLSVGFAISPGLSMAYDDDADRAALGAKVDQVLDLGIDLVCLAVDDIPVRPGLGEAHASVTTWLRHHLGDRARLILVPTEYTGTTATPYLDALATGVPADVPIAWTGATVVCDEITVAEAEARAASLGGRPPLVWDNYPVNDSIMADQLFTGPLRGRPAGLLDVTSGWMANPMVQARASLPALASVAGWLRGDDPERAWRSSLGGAATFCEGCDGEVPNRLVARLGDVADGPGWGAALGDAHRWFRAAATCAAPGMEDEVGPWLARLHEDASLAVQALRCIQAAKPVVSAALDGRGRASGPDLVTVGETALALAARWPAARRAEVSVLGARCGVRPVMGQWPDGSWAFRSASVTTGANALDAVVGLALEAADAVVASAPPGVRPAERRAPLVDGLAVEADGQPVPVAHDGTFRAPAGAPVTARWGGLATTVAPGAGPPLAESRLDAP